jgi:hypothetical protein
MKLTLIAGAAVLLLSSVCANAGPTTWIKLDNSPNIFAITRQGDTYAQYHYFGGEPVGMGVGMAASTKDVAIGVMLTDSGLNGGKYICYDFQRPFKSGGIWVAYETVDGRNVQWVGSGTYSILPRNPVQ